MKNAALLLKSEAVMGLIDIVDPVLRSMPAGSLSDVLLESFTEESESLATIEECFLRLTSKKQDATALKHFFKGWSHTNHSAASVAGLMGRLTLPLDGLSDEKKLATYGVVNSLQRIIDEDLGSLGGVLHSDLYYRMATTICGDDTWQSKQYNVPAAIRFSETRDQIRLRDRNIMHGILHILIHEVYTHGEVELIHEPFHGWLMTHMGLSRLEAKKDLAWITVHTNGTESDHFEYACDAIVNYCKATGSELDPTETVALFRSYLRQKAAVMKQLNDFLS